LTHRTQVALTISKSEFGGLCDALEIGALRTSSLLAAH
jgi:hypothetical protein